MTGKTANPHFGSSFDDWLKEQGICLDEKTPVVQDVRFEGDSLTVLLTDGREIATPLSWYPRLVNATPAQRRNWRLIGAGEGIHWADVDEDLSVAALLQPESTDPEYLAWKKAKVAASIRHMDEHPDDFLTHEEVCRKFGVLIPEEGEIVSGVDAEGDG